MLWRRTRRGRSSATGSSSGSTVRTANWSFASGRSTEGGATRVIQASALEDLPPVLERLTEDHSVESSQDGELLCLVLGAR